MQAGGVDDELEHTLSAAGAATRVPHRSGAAGAGAVEFLGRFGRTGERAHLRAGPAGER